MNRQELLAILQAETVDRRRRTGQLRNFVGAMVIALVALTAIRMAKTGFDFNSAMSLFAFIPLIGISSGFSVAAKRRLVASLGLTDPRALGPFIEALDCGDAEVVKTIRDVLKDRLPTVNEGDLSLDAVQWQALHGSLALGDPVYRKVVIEALGQIGGKEALPYLEQTSKGNDAVLKEAALKALPTLRIRLAKTVIDGELRTAAWNLAEVDAHRELAEDHLQNRPTQ